MDEITSGLDPDEMMDLDEPEGSDLEEDEEEIIDDPVPSPFQLLSSGPGSTATSVASSPSNTDDFPTPFNFTGKPLNIKRGRGRPRREGGKPIPRTSRGGGTGTTRMRRPRPPGFSRRGGGRSFRQPDRTEFDMSLFTPSPSDEMTMLDPETGSLIFQERERPLPSLEEPPYFPEQWPGKVCAFCNLGERSQLGQGDMLRLNCPENFSPQKMASEQVTVSPMQAPERDSGDKSPRGPVTCRRQKSFNKCRHPSMTSEYVDELTIIGYNEIPDVSVIFEPGGQFYAHRNCALWSHGVTRAENTALLNVGPVVLQSSSKKCSFCNHYGASLMCNMEGCTKIYHFPCATASGAFQELISLTTFCSSHLGQVAMLCESSVCYTCKTLGDIANLMFCSICSTHYHGICVGLAQLPGVRAGWQCRKCRCCQVCRVTGDETKLMSCEQCDKVYHASCQRPVVTSIPKYGWKCRCCRVCGDCGSRTPGAGLSSRWHAHYTVCDSCYQQRNKGFSCPLCHRAYRAHAHREMVQCTMCRKFVHGTCDPEADLVTYHQRREAHPDYEYVCSYCKNLTQSGRQLTSKRSSTDDPSELSVSQESLYDDTSEFDLPSPDEFARNMGLGKGKPYSASKIAKKRLGFSTGMPGRPKGTGKALPGKVGFMKRARLTEFGRKRGPKAKMRGVFGVPGVGLQRPVSDGKNDEEPGVENRLVLCSAKDKFVLTQDICVMCGALGTDQEGCLIACVQCGQCYHPYCVNVKVTKVILQKGWRCLDCTVCEGCGQRNDEGRLILCDDCDVSYHIYCMDPPLDYVPHGNWKCKWCAICQNCGASDPGFNCTWMNSWTECGPCASHVNCPSCNEPYSEGDLIIQCVQCERWLHGTCDFIKTEEDAEKCAEEGYNCILCRPRDVPPPHLVPSPAAPKPPTPTKSPEMSKNTNFVIDGICLSEMGHSLIKSLSMEYHGTRKKRKKIPTIQDKEAGIMATIESVVAGGNTDNALEESAKLELVDVKEEPQEMYKEGMIWTKEDGPPPEGFTVFTMESGISVLRRKRQRNLQKLGIGGFLVRMRGIRTGQDNDDIDTLPGQSNPQGGELATPLPADGEKPRRKPIRRKPKSKLAETFPAYLQEAFFGKELLDGIESKKEVDSCSSDDEKGDKYKSIKLSQDELMAVAAVTAKQEKLGGISTETKDGTKDQKLANLVPKEEDDDNTEDLKDVLALPGDLLDTELVNSIINEDDDELTKNTESLEALDSNLPDDNELADTLGSSGNSKDTKDELSDILGPHFNLEYIPNINSKDVEDMFKGVLTDESQESQESNAFPMSANSMFSNANAQQPVAQHPIVTPPVRPTTLSGINQSNLNSPVSFPPPSPYHSEYSNSPQFSPAFSEPPSPWVNVNEHPDIDSTNVGVPSTYNQRSSEKMRADEGLGNGATISAVLYANMNHPEWKTEYPNWSDRYKQIIKKWRTLSQEQKAPFLQQARDNRSQLRMKKAQQDQEKIALQQKSAREAEQERQWKQLQAMRQQQAQQQQHVIHEQRVQAIARVQRQISTDPNQPFIQDQQSPLQATTPQDLSPVTSPSPISRPFLGIKSPTFPLPSPISAPPIRPPTPSQSPHDFPQPTTPDNNDPYAQAPATPKPIFQPRLPADPYAHQPATPRPQFPINRPPIQGFGSIRPEQQEVNINRQLRDLLQRQQFKKLDELLPGKTQQRVWPPVENQDAETPTTTVVSSADGTFRQPLPPSVMRPRMTVSVGNRPIMNTNPMRLQQIDPRIQGLDPRMRLIIQQQQVIQSGDSVLPRFNVYLQQRLAHTSAQGIQQQFVRFLPGAVRPTTVEQFELLHRQNQLQNQNRAADLSTGPRLPINQNSVVQRPPLTQPPTVTTAAGAPENNVNEEGIPDNVTAELEKLEQETGTMVELQGVSDILGGLGDDDDELLAEMGADFNILEYADPELETLTGGKTNILDLELEEEPIKKDNKNSAPATTSTQKQPVTTTATATAVLKKDTTPVPSKPAPLPMQTPEQVGNLPPPPPLATSQSQQVAQQQQQAPHPPPTQQPPPQPQPMPPQHLTPQQIHQQMLHQVQQAAAQGRPMPPGSKMQTPDGVIGIVMPNNTVQLQVPPNYQQRFILQQLQHQKLQMRVGQAGPRMMSVQVSPSQQLHPPPVGLPAGPRMGAAAPPPPPPPYPGPPPPYPGNVTPQHQPQQTGLRMGPGHLSSGHMHPMTLQGLPMHPHLQRRPLLLEEQPLLLEDLLEQEKREQEKLQNQPPSQEVSSSTSVEPEPALLSDHDFERLKADVFSSGPVGINSPISQGSGPIATQPSWQQNQSRPPPAPTPQVTTEITTRVQIFNANLMPAPPLPPENIITEQDKQSQMLYEQWLNHQNNVLTQQLRYYETEVQKLRKSRKSLNSKQRQLRKSGNQLTEADAAELQRISADQAILQKHLESSRKQSRQHGMLIQEYRNKQQTKQSGPGQSPLQQIHSPLGPPASSPIHHPSTSQSPMMSPSASPLTQHSSPMNSPGPIVSHSPGPGSVQNLLQSPSSMPGNNMSPMQPSPRIGTPHSQKMKSEFIDVLEGEGSPGPVQSPSQVCLPPPVPRMTSPQHRRMVTSPVAAPQMRFVRTPIDHAALQQRVRLQSSLQNFQQKPGTPSPLNSPPAQQISQQLQLQKQLHQQALLQQQGLDSGSNEGNILHRAAQLLQHRNLLRQQQVAQQQQQQSQQQAIGQPQPLTPQQHQMMLQQQKQLAQQQQQQIAQLQARLSQQQINPPQSPMPPKSPMVSQQIMSPHSMPASPMQMPPKSPMVSSFGSNQPNPNSPVARSPAFHQGIQPPSSPMTHSQYQPPSSPMARSPMLNQTQSPHGIRRPPSANSSPAMPDRPHSVENLETPRTPFSMEHMLQESQNNAMSKQNENMQSGGGNPNNPWNPIPSPPGFGRFGYVKLGLRGGSPMWNYGRGAKRIPTPPSTVKPEDKLCATDSTGMSSPIPKLKKESHLSKVSILKRKSPAKTNLQSLAISKVGSLVSTDYNEFDDSSSTPPVTPPPLPSTSRVTGQKSIPKKILVHPDVKDSLMVMHSAEQKSLHVNEIMDYDDDNNTVLSAEVSLSAAAQQTDGDDIVEIETLSQSDLGGLASPLESDQMTDEYLLFSGNMVVEEDEAEEEYSEENMHIVIRSPTTSDDEFIMQGKTKKYNIVGHPDHLLGIADTPESPEQEDMNVDPSPEPADDDVLESEILIIDPNAKSPEDSISTKEDFEELIDEGSRKDNLRKRSEVITAKHISDFHKYASIFNYTKNLQTAAATSGVNTARIANVMTQKLSSKISLIASPVVQNLTAPPKTTAEKLILAQNAKVVNATNTSKVTSIILAHNNAVRGNVLSVPNIVTTIPPAIKIVSASTSQIASILPSKFTVPVISASAVRQLPNVKVIDKPSSSLSLTTHDSSLPKKIFEDDSVSPDSSNCEDDKSKDSSDEKSKTDSPTADDSKPPLFAKNADLSDKNISAASSKPALEIKGDRKHEEKLKEAKMRDKTPPSRKVEHLTITSLVTKEQAQKQRVPSPIISKTSPPVIIHNTPELKMTAQVIQETQPHMQITATTETVDAFDGSTEDTKSVVISIPSPTPSQEQMLDNIALQALENRSRREFESFEDVLDMIENITAEPPAILEENVTIKEQFKPEHRIVEENKILEVKEKVEPPKEAQTQTSKIETQVAVNVSTSSKSSVVPQLSPLSQPTDLTTNMANASQQLRTLLSSLQTTSTSAPTNVESIVKNIGHKIVSSASPTASSPIVASRVIQQAGKQPPVVTSLNTVIVPNMKPKPTPVTTNPPRSSPIRTQHIASSTSSGTSTLSFLSTRTVGGIHLMPDHPKLPPVTSVIGSQQTSSSITTLSSITQKSLVTSSPITTTSESRKPSLTLTAMLQNQPAATMTTKSSADTITAASLLGSPISIAKTGFTTALVQAQPNVVVSPVTTNNMVPQSVANLNNPSVIATPSSMFRPTASTTNLLHTQLTKVRPKIIEEPKEIKLEEVKQELPDISTSLEDNKIALIKQELTGCKYSSIPTPICNRTEDSQNVLLKKLLQNTACASTQSPPPNTTSSTTTSAPTSSSATNIDNNLAKNSTPTLSSLLPPVIKTEPQIPITITQPQQKAVQRVTIRETSFVSSPVPQQNIAQTSIVTTQATQQLHIDVKKCLPASRTPSRDDLLSPQTPRSSCSQESSLQTPPLIMKKELPSVNQHQQSPILTTQEVKKEFVDDSSQHSEVSDHSRSDIQMKEELDSVDPSTDKIILDKEELKKQKRRMYQQKRRQNQILNKELSGQPKKRPRKNSKIDEDYDTYIDGVLAQLRQLPPMTVSEPVLNRNFGVMPVFGSGDMSKLGTKCYSSQFGDLMGTYGNAVLPGYSDYYNTKPYGDEEPLPEKPPASTQRGFYDQEFPLIRFDTDEDKKFDLFCREDTPDSIVSSSSPECVQVEPPHKFLGLRLISDDEEDGSEEKDVQGRISPVVPMIKPLPIRLKPAGGLYLKDYTDNKENIDKEVLIKSKPDSKPTTPVKDSGNVTVTLTLTSSAAEDIMGVLRDLANILHIPAPTSYQIVERTSTPPSQKLGLYRTKGKDGKEGAPIDIQSILNGAAKFCKHCDVVILNNMIRRKVSDLPFLAKDSELLSDGEELYFCSSSCYMQFALMHRSPSISEDKAAAIIDHLSQKDKMDMKHRKSLSEVFDNKAVIAQRVSMDYRDIRKEEPMDTNDFPLYQHSELKHHKYSESSEFKSLMPLKPHKNIRYKFWIPGCLQPAQKHKRPTDKEIMELLYKLQITVTPPRMPDDTRKCMFCQGIGDGVADGPARLLNFDVDKWVHLNCGLWSDGVYETVNGALMNLENAIQMSLVTNCIHCNKFGATIRCFKTRCTSVYHLSCAVKDRCVFFKNKTVYCTVHVPKNEKDNELTTLSVSRRVYVNRDENRQVAAIMHHSDTNNLLRVGSLIFLNVGQLLPHQLQNFHTPNYIYPIGYKIIRFFWSMRRLNKRCRYICSIHDVCGRPEFRVLIQEQPEEDVEYKDQTPRGVWLRIVEQISALRKENSCLQMFPKFATGEDLFGLTEPAIVRVLESLPGIETLTDYKFKYGRNPLLELPLAINPSGAARTEPRLRNQMHWKRPHTQRTMGATVRPLFGPSPSGPSISNSSLGEMSCPYSKQFVHSKSSQYKKMKQEWRNNVYLARSKIQGLGLYAARDLEKHTMVIEYIGEIIRTELAECREKQYEAKNRGIYMFRLDEERVVDATLCGGLARYINHSCNPNCVAETVEVERDVRIIIFAKRRIQRGEELSYDYKFDIEDDQHKISCMCGAPNCRKWMN
ncbi:histone-lysine N-methyltransferase 2C isoform X6 [Anoplophora glabripennis]|uniref:histone-lysine N-methyltransferase 2C isoform X6 n=1 Tax=Anoplophora glabripennis TaxID=217634 RepID=UPI000C77D081|nr:histone-lysine N-methyltransferase 2C isoform X6 [Anoplophora glabripennis]